MPTRTFTQYLLKLGDNENGDVAPIMSAMSVLVRQIGGILGRFPLEGEGEGGSTPDPLAETRETVHALLEESLIAETASIKQLGAISISEMPEIFQVCPDGKYLLLVDMLHGMANVRDNLTVGTVFSILERAEAGGPVSEDDFLQPGTKQVAAGAALFGLRTLLLVTTGSGVDAFTHDRELGSLIRSRRDMRVPRSNPVFVVDSSRAPRWPDPVVRYIDECTQGEDGPRGLEFTMRWDDSAVVGAYRVLNGGGLFLAPDTGRKATRLPLLHNAAPLAFIATQAGGGATTGRKPVMDVVPDSLNHRIGYYLGSADEVRRVERYFDEYDKGTDKDQSYALFRERSLFTD